MTLLPDDVAQEASARTSAALLSSVLDHAPIVLFAVDREGRFIARHGSVNVGQRLSSLGQSAFELFANVPEVAVALRRALGGETERGEVFLHGRNFEFVYTPMFEADGTTVAGVTGLATDITDRKQAQAQLEQHAGRLAEQAELLNLANDAILVWDFQSGLVRFWNRGAEQLYGWSSEEVVGRRLSDILFTEFPRPLSEINATLFADHRWEGELTHSRRDGTRLVVASRWALQVDDQGRPQSVMGINADITDRKRAEQAMLQLQEHNRLLIDNANDAVVTFDVGGHVTFVNRRWEELTGYSVDAALSMSLGAVMHPDDREWVRNRMRACLGGERASTSWTARICRSNGAVRWIDANVSVLRRGSEVLGLEAFLRDITERVEAEAALRESEARKSAMLAGALDAIISTDDSGRITEFNPAAERMFGSARHDVLGRDVTQVIAPGRLREPEGGGMTYASMAKADGLIGQRVETVLVRADGSEFPAELAITEFRVEDRTAFTAYLRDISGRKRAEARLAYEATHDALTGLPNRSLFRQRLEATLADLDADATSVGLMLLDLDRFKEVNDTLGHVVGDRVLRLVTERLSGQLRPEDTIARLGGDEFAIIVPGLSPISAQASAEAVARRLCAALEDPMEIEGMRLTVGASIGLVFGPTHGDDAATLLRRADVAMYAAKRSGRGVSIYSSELDRDNLDRLALSTELREAIERNQLVLHYQPKVDLAGRRLVGVEALVRWQHPRRGLLGPGEFIEVAEQTGLIEPLTHWVVRAARQQQSEWQADGLITSVAVNLSMRSVRDPQFLDAVREVLTEHSTIRGGFELELTESTLMADPERACQLLTEFRALGMRIAVDDFGTGYSSLAYLKRLPLDELKIDRCFVQDLGSDTRDRALVKATIDLAHTLGLRVVAEGVEDAACLEVLESLGCDLAQGYHLSRPLTASALRTWAADWAFGQGSAQLSTTRRAA